MLEFSIHQYFPYTNDCNGHLTLLVDHTPLQCKNIQSSCQRHMFTRLAFRSDAFVFICSRVAVHTLACTCTSAARLFLSSLSSLAFTRAHTHTHTHVTNVAETQPTMAASLLQSHNWDKGSHLECTSKFWQLSVASKPIVIQTRNVAIANSGSAQMLLSCMREHAAL